MKAAVTWTRAAVMALLLVAAGSASAQTPPSAGDQFKPYLQVNPVPGDESKVRAYFSPSCPFSRAYFQFFKNLAATLPGTKTFEFTPVVNEADGLSYALSFVAVQRYFPAYLNNFVEASFIGVQDRHLSTRNWAAIDVIAKAAHVPASVPQLVKDHKNDLERAVLAAIGRQNAMSITNTPAVSVNGTYIVTPEFTNGDAALFSQLVNGLISMQ